jgi:signal transduction histidine kinase
VDYQPRDVLELPADMMPKEVTDKRGSGVIFDKTATRLVSELRNGEGKLIGILTLQRHNDFKFGENEKKFARVIADRLANAMHMAILMRKVHDMNQYRHQLFRMLSHDLRQPLTVLMGYIQLLEFAITNQKYETVAEYASHIGTGAKDLKELLEEVLLMERVAALSRDNWETISLRKICEQAVEKHSNDAALAHHTIEVSFPKDDADCKGLALELKEAAGNLIANAIKYTPGEGTIIVSLSGDDGRWYFEVRDNGYGIDPARQERLFESFYRAQQPGTENIKGTGLGLSLVKEIIVKHDGDVFFESTPGEGSTFGFWLPGV